MVLKWKEKSGISLRMTVFNAKMKRLILPFLQWYEELKKWLFYSNLNNCPKTKIHVSTIC